MRRALPAFLVWLAAVLAAGQASAQLSLQFWSRECATDERDELEDGINLEECQGDCTITMRYSYSGSLSAGDLYVYIGTGCDLKENRDEGDCFPAYEDLPLETLGNIEIHPAWIVDPLSDIPACTEGEGASDVYFLVLADDSAETVVYQVVFTVDYDTEPPEPPVDISAGYGEGLISVSWEVADEDFPEEWANFYVMCWGGGATPDGDEPGPEPVPDAVTDPDVVDVADVDDALEEDAAGDAAPDTVDAADVAADPDAGADTGTDPATDGSTPEGCPSGGFVEGDPYDEAYACSSRLGSTSRSYDLTGLTNDQPYKVSVVAVDEFGNKSDVGVVVCATPSAVDDFWEVYKKAGGGDDGGFCFVATAAFGDYGHPAVRWLRLLRDEVIAPLPGGGRVVDAYYEMSPSAAVWIRDHAGARLAVRAALWPVALAARAAVAVHRAPGLALAALALAACLAALGVVMAGRRRGAR